MEFLKYMVEFIGTFILLSVILNSASAGLMAAFPIGLALSVAHLFGERISGGNFNPAVTVMLVASKALPWPSLIPYILAQCLGGLAALGFYNLTK